jgi:hypothetical protein
VLAVTSDLPVVASDTWNTPATFLDLVREVMGGIEPGRLVPLTHWLFAVVDAEDFERVSARRWFACPSGRGRIYARSSSASPRVSMHRFIVDAPVGLHVDHANGCTLDNRRSNLRLCTPRENSRNQTRKAAGRSSRFKGVSHHEGRWRAVITVDRALVWLGRFATELEAAHAYDAAAVKHFGEFAAPNFPQRA